MQIEQQYPIKIEHWFHLPLDKFTGYLTDNGYNYIFGITPEDKIDNECIYVNIWIEKKILNKTTNTIVFLAKTYSCFKIRNKFQKPSQKFFFELVEKAAQEFASQFHFRTRNTNLSHLRIRKPIFSDIIADIEKTINIWDKKYRNSMLATPINWQAKFRNLPEIPVYKQWAKDSYSTIEQDISYKLINNQPISKEEEIIFKELESFYKELDEKLIKLNYHDFTTDDFENFKNYIFYAFNFISLISDEYSISGTYRLVVNEEVRDDKKNESITDITLLKYPSIDKVKEIGKYNRANTPDTNVFYSAENIDTALKEKRPGINKLITVGIWEPKNKNKKFIAYPLSHSDVALNLNEDVKKATEAFENNKNFSSPLFKNYMRHYFKLLGREFSKTINYNNPNHHYEYLISSLFSERIFARSEEGEAKGFKYDCIIYPSVNNNYLTCNLAILPDTLDNHFYLKEVIEFEISEEFYDKKYIPLHPEQITLAKIKNLRRTRNFNSDGKIVW